MLKDTAWNIFSNTGCIHCYMLYKEASQLNSAENSFMENNTIDISGSGKPSEALPVENPAP